MSLSCELTKLPTASFTLVIEKGIVATVTENAGPTKATPAPTTSTTATTSASTTVASTSTSAAPSVIVQSSGLSTGAIVGIAIGSLCGGALLVVLGFILYKHDPKQPAVAPVTPEKSGVTVSEV